MSVKKAIISLLILALVGTGVILVLAKKQHITKYNSVIARRGELVQTVSETGTVKATKEYALSFLNAGKLAKVNVVVGDFVKKGNLLAELDYSTLEIQRKEAKASLEVAQASLSRLLDGASDADIEVARAGVTQAQSALDAAKKNLATVKSVNNEIVAQAQKTKDDLESSLATDITTYEQAIITAQTNLDNTESTYLSSVNDKVGTALVDIEEKIAEANVSLDVINQVLDDTDGKDYIGAIKPLYITETNDNHDKAEQLINDITPNLNLAKNNYSSSLTGSVLDDTLNILNTTFKALKDCFSALDNSVTTSSFTLADVNSLKSTISAQQTIISTAISAIQSSIQNLDTAVLNYNTNVNSAKDALQTARVAYNNALKNARDALATAKLNRDKQVAAAEASVDSASEALSVAIAQLNKVEAPANRHEVYLNQAKIKQAQAVIQKIDKQIDNSKIYSPIDGTVTKVNFDPGEQVGPSVNVISLLSEENFEIEILVSETDIAKVHVDDQAEITLDAFGDDVKFYSKVSFIEPAETEVQDVIYYKVKVALNPGDKIVKSGMTANVEISTNRKENVLLVPGRAIIEKSDNGKFVRVIVNNEIHEIPVIVGLRGDNGLVEISSGLKEGTEIVTSLIDPGK